MVTNTELKREVTFSTAHNGRTAIITIDRQSKLNALTQDHYFRIAELLNEIAHMPEVVVTVVTGRGRFFSAGADVTIARSVPNSSKDNAADKDVIPITPRKHWTSTFVANNLHNSAAWYAHPKILIVALNGPAVGISAAFTAHADFVFAAPHAWILVPFTSLGLNAEGAASRALVEKLGVNRANEALLMSRKILMPALVSTGYVTAVIEGCGGDAETGKGIDTDVFLKKVLEEVDDKLGPHLVKEAMLDIKKQIRASSMGEMERANHREVLGGLEVFVKGIPQREFEKIARGEKRHKL